MWSEDSPKFLVFLGVVLVPVRQRLRPVALCLWWARGPAAPWAGARGPVLAALSSRARGPMGLCSWAHGSVALWARARSPAGPWVFTRRFPGD